MKLDWLDPQTRAILYPNPPSKLAPASLARFSLLLFTHGPDAGRVNHAAQVIQSSGEPNATTFPFVIRQRLSLDEALRGQFELACCDCISAFVRDEVILATDRQYLAELYTSMVESPEFQTLEVNVVSVPCGESGRQFMWQFFGWAVGAKLPMRITATAKKLRLMRHWAQKIGAVVDVT